MAEKLVQFNTKQFDKFFKKLGKSLKHSFVPLRSAVNIWGFKDIIDHFSMERGEEGRWKKRSASTQRAYKRRGKAGNRLLQDSGSLRKSFLPGAGRTARHGQNDVLMFTHINYAGTHNRGDPKRNIPKREFMWLSDKALDNMAKTFLDEIF